MMTHADNCLICAQEYPITDLKTVSLSAINITKFKICNGCLNQVDPADDYYQVRNIVNNFFNVERLLK